MQADFDDIRFTSSDGTTLIDHWLESKTDSTTADFWVEIPSIPASPNTTMIYIYYGNSSASSASNGDNTFLLFDNFDGVSMDGFSRVSQQTLFSGSGSEDWLGRTVFVDDGSKWVLVYRQAANHCCDTAAVMHIRFSTNEGASWTNADTFTNGSAVTGAPFSRHSTNAVADPVLMKAPNGDLLLHVGEVNSGGNPMGAYQYRSTDGGATWTDEGLINNDTEIYSGQDYTTVDNDLYAIFWKDAGSDGAPYQTLLYKSTDNGITWALVSPITTSGTDEGGIEYVGSNTLLVVLRDTPASKTYQRISTDLGQTWGTQTDISSSVGVLQRPRMRIFSDEPNRVYLYGRDQLAGNDYTVLYYTDNNGSTWSLKFYPDTTSYADTGYSDVLKQTDGDFYMLSYGGTSGTSSIKEYIFNKSATLQIDTTKWTTDNATTSISNSQLTYQETDTNITWGVVKSVNSVSRPFIAEIDYTLTSGEYAHFMYGPNPDSAQSTANGYVWWIDINDPTNPMQDLTRVEDGTFNDIQRNVQVSPDIANNETFNQKFIFHSTGETALTNGTQYISGSDTTYSSGKIALGTDSGSVVKVNTIKVRVYANPEPTSSIGSEATLYDTSNPTVQPTSANSLTFVSLSAFSETATKNGGQIKYQVSNDSGTTWCWYSSGWTTTSSGYSESNTASDVNTNISTFPVGSGSFLFKAYLNSDGSQLVQLDAIGVTYVADNTPPSISLTALSPDPNTDTTPTLSGTATDTQGTVSNVQFQMDSTSGSWTACTAGDGSFDETTETFTCTPSALSDGSHTMYVRATDSNSNTTSNANASTDSFTIDITTPASFDLDSPGDNSYTNSERPTFKWKATTDATAGLSKYVLEIDNPSIGSGQPSGDFTIDSIPTSRTTDYETNKYTIHYENFSDSDSTNNYISVYTKSHNDWGSSENDGKLREGKVSWKVKAVDNAGNERSSSRTMFMDKTSPSVVFTQINSTPYTTNNFLTTDKTPTIFGKITDSLSGGDSSQTQDENGPKVASAPKEVNIKVEKKEGLTYKLVTLYKINMDNPYYTCDPNKTIDNSKQKCDKYLPFEYTPKEILNLGTYKITLSGKDKADNTSSETSFTLNITTLAQITTPEEKEIIEEGIKELPKEEQEKVKEELEITKPSETPQPNILEKASQGVVNISKNIIHGAGNLITTIFTGIGNGISFVFNGVGSGLAFMGNTIGNSYSTLVDHAPGVTKNILLAVGTNVNNAINEARNGIANLAFSIGEKTDDVSHGVGTAIIKIGYLFVPEATKISNVTAVALSPMSVRITWETNHPANGKVNWGFEDGIYEFEDQTHKRTSKHEFVLENLKPDTEYHYEVMSQNRNYVYDANRKFKTPAK